MPKIIIGLVGPVASGKDAAKKYIESKYSASSYKLSDALRDILKRLHLPISRTNLQDLSYDLRQRFGGDILSQTISADAQNDPSAIVIIDGVRRLEDISHLRSLPEFRLISVDADLEKRFERMRKRNENAGDAEKSFADFVADCQKEAEKEIPAVMATAAYQIDNNGSLDDLYHQIDKILSEFNL